MESRLVPLSGFQARLLAHWKKAREDPGLDVAYTIDGPLDRDRLVVAIHAVFENHSVLRTAIVQTSEMEAQLVSKDAKPIVLFASGTLPELSLRAARAFVQANFGEDLIKVNHAPMWFICVIRLSVTRSIVYGYFSRFVCDYISTEIVMGRILDAYGAALSGTALPDDAPRTIQFEDHVHEQRAWIASDAPARMMDQWMERLPAESITRAPAPSRVDPSSASFESDGCALDSASVKRANDIAAREGTDLFAVLLCTLAMIELRVRAREDIRLGTTLTGRSGPGLQHAVGPYEVSSVIAFHADRDAPVRAVFENVKASLAFALACPIGIEDICERLSKRYGFTVQLPFTTYCQFIGQPAILVPPTAPVVIKRLSTYVDAALVDDPRLQLGIKFVQAADHCVMYVRYPAATGDNGYFVGLCQSFRSTFASVTQRLSLA